jgi:hypothetical protein
LLKSDSSETQLSLKSKTLSIDDDDKSCQNQISRTTFNSEKQQKVPKSSEVKSDQKQEQKIKK